MEKESEAKIGKKEGKEEQTDSMSDFSFTFDNANDELAKEKESHAQSTDKPVLGSKRPLSSLRSFLADSLNEDQLFR